MASDGRDVLVDFGQEVRMNDIPLFRLEDRTGNCQGKHLTSPHLISLFIGEHFSLQQVSKNVYPMLAFLGEERRIEQDRLEVVTNPFLVGGSVRSIAPRSEIVKSIRRIYDNSDTRTFSLKYGSLRYPLHIGEQRSGDRDVEAYLKIYPLLVHYIKGLGVVKPTEYPKNIRTLRYRLVQLNQLRDRLARNRDHLGGFRNEVRIRAPSLYDALAFFLEKDWQDPHALFQQMGLVLNPTFVKMVPIPGYLLQLDEMLGFARLKWIGRDSNPIGTTGVQRTLSFSMLLDGRSGLGGRLKLV